MKKDDIWAEGKYIDLWSLNHIVAGLLMLPILLWLGLTPMKALAVSFVLFSAWEVMEWFYEVEMFLNQLGDMVTNYMGFGFAWYIYVVNGTNYGEYGFWIFVGAYIILEALGFAAFMRRKTNYQ